MSCPTQDSTQTHDSPLLRGPHAGIQQDTLSRGQRNKKESLVAEGETRGSYNSGQAGFGGGGCGNPTWMVGANVTTLVELRSSGQPWRLSLHEQP